LGLHGTGICWHLPQNDYLDLDGVVHDEAVLWHPRKGIYMSPYQPADHALFDWLLHLEEVLSPFPAIALVLNSTWCIWPG